MKRCAQPRFLLAWCLLLAFSVPRPLHADDTEGPKRGTLLIVGGGGKQAAAIWRRSSSDSEGTAISTSSIRSDSIR